MLKVSIGLNPFQMKIWSNGDKDTPEDMVDVDERHERLQVKEFR